MNKELTVRLLKAIEKNSRISNHDLAIQFGLEEAEVAQELERLEKSGIIAGYHTMVDWEKTGIEKVTALIQVKVSPQKDDGFAKIAAKICKYSEVYDVSLISGADCDYLVTIQGKTLQEVAHFVNTKLAPIDGVTSTATNFILEKYKEHGKDYNRKLHNERMVVTP